MSSFDNGINYAIAGLISSLVINYVLVIPDWGSQDLLMLSFAFSLNIVLALSTFFDIMKAKIGFVAGYVFMSLLFLIAGIT